MTLVVNVYIRNDDELLHFIEGSASAELAGFETCRRNLWGSNAARSLGLTLLPSLAQGDLSAEGGDLAQLENEANLILSHLDVLTAQTGWPADFIQQRAQNILGAVERAKQIRGGVYIG